MEPRTSSPRRRLEAIKTLSDAGVPVGVMVAPIIPGLTDHETPGILAAAAEAGARCAAYVSLRLPWALAGLFEDWLGRHFPDRKEKVLNRIRSLRGGKLNDPNFTTRMRGQGVWAEQLKTMFDLAKRKAGLTERLELDPSRFRVPGGQMTLFG
jgi:DNA repair photolyase